MVNSPNQNLSREERLLELQEQIDAQFADLIDQYVIAGYGTIETIEAMEEILRHRRVLYSEDPEPAEDRYIPEPANDWPSA